MKQNPPNDARLLREIRLSNLLSFGPDTAVLPLENLNVLIGPNGAGKSNLIEALALMRSTPSDIRGVVRRGGGVAEWIWKGAKGQPASISLAVNNPKGKQPLRHVFAFGGDTQGFQLQDERVRMNRLRAIRPKPISIIGFRAGIRWSATAVKKNAGWPYPR